MKHPRSRVAAPIVLFLFLLGSWGWMLPDHFCRLDSGCFCDAVQDCCEPFEVEASGSGDCCVEVDSYFNFPVFGHERLLLPQDLCWMLEHDALVARFSFQSDCSSMHFLVDRPPPLVLIFESLHIPYRNFRV